MENDEITASKIRVLDNSEKVMSLASSQANFVELHESNYAYMKVSRNYLYQYDYVNSGSYLYQYRYSVNYRDSSWYHHYGYYSYLTSKSDKYYTAYMNATDHPIGRYSYHYYSSSGSPMSTPLYYYTYTRTYTYAYIRQLVYNVTEYSSYLTYTTTRYYYISYTDYRNGSIQYNYTDYNYQYVYSSEIRYV